MSESSEVKPEQGTIGFQYTLRDSQGKKIKRDLPQGLVTKITELLTKKEIPETKRRKLQIKQLSDDTFHVRVDKTTSFHVAKTAPTAPKEGTPAPESWGAIKETVLERGFLSSVHTFWKTVIRLFYPKTLKTPGEPRRDPLKAVREDYSSLIQALRVGQSWVSSTSSKVSCAQSLVTWGTCIDRALHSRNPTAALHGLADEWGEMIASDFTYNLDRPIPLGFLNNDGVLQPLLVRFIRDANEYYLEVFNDTPEAGAKVHPTQKWKFSARPNAGQISTILTTLFDVLVPPTLAKEAPRLRGGSKGFRELFRRVEEDALKGAGISGEGKKKKEDKAEPASAHQVPSFAGVGYGGVLVAVEGCGVGLQKQNVSEVVSAPESAPSRVSKWFQHLIGKTKQDFPKDQQLELLFSMTVEWAERELARISPALSDEETLKIYESVMAMVSHAGDKIAWALTGKETDQTRYPERFQRIQEKCFRKVAVLKEKIRIHEQELTGNFAVSPQETTLPLPSKKVASSPAPAEAPLPTEKGSAPTVTAEIVSVPSEFSAQWKDKQQKLEGLTSPASRAAHNAAVAHARAETLLSRLPEDKKPRGDVFADADAIQGFVNTAVTECVEEDPDFPGLLVKVRPPIAPEKACSILRQMILYPHLIPQCPGVSGRDIGKLVSLFHEMEDPAMVVSAKHRKVFEAINALLQLRHGISQETVEELERQQWRMVPEGIQEGPQKEVVQRLVGNFEPLLSAFPKGGAVKVVGDGTTPQEVVRAFSALTAQCTTLMQAARAEKDISVRKALFQEVQDKALQILQMVPPPGTEEAFGELSVWVQLRSDDRNTAAASIHEVQQLIWETQMRLARSEMPGRARFLLLKGQAISVALVRADVLAEKKKFEAFLVEAKAQHQDLSSFPFVTTLSDGTFTIDWKNDPQFSSSSWSAFVNSLSPKSALRGMAQNIDIDLLILDTVTVDIDTFNIALSQDVTTQISGDSTLERDLTAVYRFCVRDYKHEGSLSTKYVEGGTHRTPINSSRASPLQISPRGRAHIKYNQMVSEWVMYQSCCDPDFTLYEEQPTLGVPYFSANPELLLNQQQLSLELATTGPDWITGAQGEKLAEIHVSGHPNFAYHPTTPLQRPSEEERQKMRARIPPLPVVVATERSEIFIRDIRIRVSDSRYRQYATEEMLAEQGKGIRRIDSGVMQELYCLRRAPDDPRDLSDRTSYAPETAVNALSFLGAEGHLYDLEDPRVQQFIEETLFGPFLLQQAIVECSENVQMAIEDIARVYAKAVQEKRFEAALFLQGVLYKVRAHIAFVHSSLQEQGLFSGVISASPRYAMSRGGAFGSACEYVAQFLQNEYKYNPDDIDAVMALHPLVHEIQSVKQCLDTADEMLKKLDVTVADSLFKEERGKPAIDAIADVSFRRDTYAMVLDTYRLGTTKLEKTELSRIMRGYQLLCDTTIPGNRTERFFDILRWVKETILPQILALAEGDRNALLTDIANQELAHRTPPGSILENVRWEKNSDIPAVFSARLPTGHLRINLTTMEIEDTRSSRSFPQPVLIPREWMDLPDIQKALKVPTIKAQVQRKGGESIYTWEHEGQKFTLSGRPPHVKITRTVQLASEEECTFTYEPPPSLAVTNQAAALIMDNGIWVDEDGRRFLFPHGMKSHGEKLGEVLPIDVDTKRQPVSVRTWDGAFVSCSETLDLPSPLKAVASQHVVVLLDSQKKTPVELRVKGTPIRFARRDDQWKCFLRGQDIGSLKTPPAEVCSLLEQNFGRNWHEYVIPLQVEGGFQFVMMPYPQSRNAEGSLEALQEQGTRLPEPELVTIETDGTVKGSVAAKVYMAYRFLCQAEGEKNVDVARDLYVRAEELIRSLHSDRPSDDRAQLAALSHIISLVQEGFPLSPRLLKSPAGLAMNLRLLLEVSRLQEMQRSELVGSPRQRFAAAERMTKMYEAYLVLEKSEEFSVFQRQKVYASVYLLTGEERAQLSGVGDTLLRDLSSPKGMAEFFGIQGVPAVDVPMRFVDHLDPDFLLTLLRVSKPTDEHVQIRLIKSPRPLNDLLENFWSYVRSIERDGVSVEELSFLFLPSILPAAKSTEEAAFHRTLDLQARQFLLSLAYLHEMRRRIPVEMREGIWEVRANSGAFYREEPGEASPLALVGQVRGNIKASVEKLQKSIEDLRFGACEMWQDILRHKPLSQDQIVNAFDEDGKFDRVLKEAEERLEELKKSDAMLDRDFAAFEKRVKSLIAAHKKIDDECGASPSQDMGEKRRKNKEKLLEEIRIAESEIFGIIHPLSFKREGQNSLESIEAAFLESAGTFDQLSTKLVALIPSSKQAVKDVLQGEISQKIKNLRQKIREAQEKARKNEIDASQFLTEVRDAEIENFLMISPLSFDDQGPYKRLKQDLLAIKTTGETIIDELNAVVRRGEQCISEIEEAVREFDEKISRLKAAKEDTEEALSSLIEECSKAEDRRASEELLSRLKLMQTNTFESIARLREQIEKLETEKRAYLDEEIDNPVTGGQETRGSLGGEQGSLRGIVSKLRSLRSWSKEVYANFSEALEKLEEAINADEVAKQYDKTSQGAAQCVVLPQPSLSFPEDPEIVDEMRAILNKMSSDPPPGMDQIVKDVMRKLGPVKGAKLLVTLRRYESGGLLGRLEAYAPLLVATTQVPRMVPSISEISPGRQGAGQAPTPFDDMAKSPAAKRYLTLGQLQTLTKGASRASEKQQKAVLTTISGLLRMTETALAAQLEFRKNCDSVQSSYSALSGRKEPERKEEGCAYAMAGGMRRQSVFEDSFFSDHYEAPGGMRPVPLREAETIATQRPLQSPNPQNFSAVHAGLVAGLQKTVLPEDEKSLYAQDLNQSLASLAMSNPLPYAHVVKTGDLDAVEKRMKTEILSLQESINAQREKILKRVRELPLVALPKEIQEVRLRRGSDEQLLRAVCRQHRNGAFRRWEELDTSISSLEIDETRLQALNGKKMSAQSAIVKLKELHEERQKLAAAYDSPGADRALIASRIGAIDIQYARESSRLTDFLSRCQTTQSLEDALQSAECAALMPHVRKILYLQNRLGITLRKNQLEALAEMIKSPSLLKQLRMGLGKTSVLLPFALDILASEGLLPIGMVPRALFTMNFQEMDETTRAVFELAGSQFLFTRQSLPKPFTPLSLHKLSQECASFLGALERGEYVLTTIESKASIDNKIIEVERFRDDLLERIAEEQRHGGTAPPSLTQMVDDIQKALGLLYRVKGTFELPTARLVIDEADQVARANYSVNAEVGSKKPLPKILVDTVSQIFSIIQTSADLEGLRSQIQANNQITLGKEAVDKYLKIIGKEWLAAHRSILPKFLEDESNQDKLCDWLAGGTWPFTEGREAVGAVLSELEALRSALNSSVRACLGLKVGLSADFDLKATGAVGVPASQGVTTATTKYSDPLMQLCLTSMVAMYKPQGEPFLLSQAEAVLAAIPNQPAVAIEAKQQFTKLLEKHKEGSVVLSKELAGPEPWKMFIRQQYAMRAAEQMLIYISDSQIVRPVQDTLRGCHVIGLTGTATRNLSHVITEEGMRGVSKAGRETTAEVVYRLVKSSERGLETPVATYSLTPSGALDECAECARDSGYRFLVNQAGVADAYTESEIVDALHRSGRPIVYIDVTPGRRTTDKKTVRINGVDKLLDELSDEEKVKVRDTGFFYYHTPHVRGTHFDIPTGSRGVVMLSPTVNANDRDQAIYRARELGEGHIVECRISEKQEEDLCAKLGRAPTLGDVLKVHHEQTLRDEGAEDLAAYRLSIQGILTAAADQAKKDIQLDDKELTSEQELLAQQKICQLFESFFIHPGDSDTYVRKLDAQIALGGEEPTKDHLLRLVEDQIRRADRLLGKLDGMEKSAAQAIARTAIEKAKVALEEEKKKLTEHWAQIQPQLPATTSARPQGQETAETEAEAEEQQEVKAEVTAESATMARRGATGERLGEIDGELFASIETEKVPSMDSVSFVFPGDEACRDYRTPLWSESVGQSKLLRSNLSFMADDMAKKRNVRILIYQSPKDKAPKIFFIDSSEGRTFGSFGLRYEEEKKQKFLCNSSVLALSVHEDGTFSFRETAVGCMAKGFEKLPEAEMLFGLLCIGISTFSDEQWTTMERYWASLTAESEGGHQQQEAMRKLLEDRYGRSNPALLRTIASHTWGIQSQ